MLESGMEEGMSESHARFDELMERLGSADGHPFPLRHAPQMSARAWAAFGAVSVLWGIPYLFIKVAVDDGVPPAFLAWVRVVLGAAVLLALAWHGVFWSSLRGRWRWLALFAVIEITIPFPLIAAGELHVASSLAAILIAAALPFVAVLAIRFDATERVTEERLAGLLIGLGGVVALVGIDVVGDADEPVGSRRDPDLRALLRDWADDPEAPPLIWTLAASMAAALAIASLVLTGRGPRSTLGGPVGVCDRGPGGARHLLHRGGVRDLRDACGRGRGRAGARDHVRGAGCRGRARGCDPRRAAGSGGDRRAAADPGGIVARDRRASTAGLAAVVTRLRLAGGRPGRPTRGPDRQRRIASAAMEQIFQIGGAVLILAHSSLLNGDSPFRTRSPT